MMFETSLIDIMPESWLERFPFEVGQNILSFLDTPSVCRLYLAFEWRTFAEEIEYWLNTVEVEVTADVVVQGDPTKIDFHTLAMLPACNIVVNVTTKFLQLTLWYLKRAHFLLVKLSISDSLYCGKYCADLRFLGTKLVELSLNKVVVNFKKDIPKTLRILRLEGLLYSSSLKLWEFTQLTHFEAHRCKFQRSPRLPYLMIDISQSSGFGASLDAVDLPNLRHARGQVFRVPWTQIESAHGSPKFDVRIKHFPERFMIKWLSCPNLKTVEPKLLSSSYGFYNTLDRWPTLMDDYSRDVTEDFSDEQLANLESLRGPLWLVIDMDILKNLKVLHCRFDDIVTREFILPPKLEEWKVWSNHDVKGLPPQLKKFTYIGPEELNSSDHPVVDFNSSALQSLHLENCAYVVFICSKLTKLHVKNVKTMDKCWAPNVLRLSYVGPGTLDLPGGFPSLAHLELLGWERHPLVIPQRLESVTVQNLFVPQLSLVADHVLLELTDLPLLAKIKADVVSLVRCRVSENVEITATIIKGAKCDMTLVWGITCRELECGTIDYIPTMVEKLTCHYQCSVRLKPVGKAAYELTQCENLQYLNITGGVRHFLSGPETIKLPPTVRQFRLKEVGTSVQRLHIETERRLEYFECTAAFKSKDLVTFTHEPAWLSIRYHLSFHPELMETPQDSF